MGHRCAQGIIFAEEGAQQKRKRIVLKLDQCWRDIETSTKRTHEVRTEELISLQWCVVQLRTGPIKGGVLLKR